MPIPAVPFQNPDGPAPEDQNKNPANLLYDPITHAVVSERAVNVAQDATTKVWYGDKAAPSGGSMTNDGTFAQETGGHLANIDAALGGQGDTPAASPTVTGSIIAFLKAILAGILSPVVPSYEYNSGTTGTVDRVRNAQGKGYATAAINSGGAATGQNVVTLATSAPASLQVGMQIQLIGGTEEPADITAISGQNVTLSANIVNASHTSIGWDTFSVNGPLANLFSAIGVSLRGLVLYNPNASVATPYQQAQSDGNGALKIATSDGAQVTIGAKADATTNDTTSAWSLISLLKGIYAKVAGTLAVSGTFWQATQPVSATALPLPTGATSEVGHIATVDTSTAAMNTAVGAKADSTTNDTTSAWSLISLLKGIYAKVAGTLSVSGTFWQATQPTSIADGSNSTLGQKADTAITDSTTTNTQMSFMKGFVKILADVWDSTNHLFHFNLKMVGGIAVGPTNPQYMDGSAQQGPVNITVAGGATGGTTPTYTGTCSANADNLITFASKVRTVQLHNQSAVNIPYEHDITSTAVSPYLAPGQLVYVDVHSTTIHVFPPNALPINAASGLIVRGWA